MQHLPGSFAHQLPAAFSFAVKLLIPRLSSFLYEGAKCSDFLSSMLASRHFSLFFLQQKKTHTEAAAAAGLLLSVFLAGPRESSAIFFYT